MENGNGRLEFLKEVVRLQQAMDAGKGRQVQNASGKTLYSYRNAEDINVAFKKLKSYLFLNVTTKMVPVNGKLFTEATATLTDFENSVSATEYAELADEFNKNGDRKLSPAQASGSASSFAKKYALSSLFGLDDERDADALAAETNGESIKSDVSNNSFNKVENVKKTSVQVLGNKSKYNETLKEMGFKNFKHEEQWFCVKRNAKLSEIDMSKFPGIDEKDKNGKLLVEFVEIAE